MPEHALIRIRFPDPIDTMNSNPCHRGWPALRDTSRSLLESKVHEIYRDIILLVNPSTPLDSIVIHRLYMLDLPLTRRPVTCARLDQSCKDLSYLVEQYGIYVINFYRYHMTTCINVLSIIFRLENLRDFEEDMKTRWTNRLKSLRMLRKWSPGSETWVWVLETNEQVPEGLTRKRRRSMTRRQQRMTAQLMETIWTSIVCSKIEGPRGFTYERVAVLQASKAAVYVCSYVFVCRPLTAHGLYTRWPVQ
jgi:hypothetical protein